MEKTEMQIASLTGNVMALTEVVGALMAAHPDQQTVLRKLETLSAETSAALLQMTAAAPEKISLNLELHAGYRSTLDGLKAASLA